MITLTDRKPLAAPYGFTGAYSECYSFRPTAMDERHVFIVHEILTAWPFAEALEIGSFNGASSTAFVEAINNGMPMSVTFCDVSLSESLLTVARNCRNLDRVRVTAQPSWGVLDSALPFDFILVDASHDLDSVSLEVKKLLARRPLCVMAHDTNATAAGYSKCEGAEMLKRTFQSLDGYRCIEDAIDRPGEDTKRGLFLATTDPALHNVAEMIFKRWDNQENR